MAEAAYIVQKILGERMLQNALAKASPTLHREQCLKALFLQHCVAGGIIDKSWCISSEYRLDGNSRRADLALLGGGRFIGVEFKSPRDTVKRLTGQMDTYLQVFDEVILVVADKHIDKALTLTPASVTIYAATAEGAFYLLRPAHGMSEDKNTNRAFIQSMPKTRLAELVGCRDAGRAKSQLLQIANSLPAETVRSAALSSFLSRYGDTSRLFWRKTRGKTITAQHLQALSRFAKRRKVWQQHQKRNERFWSDWSKKASLRFDRAAQSSQSSSVSYLASGVL